MAEDRVIVVLAAAGSGKTGVLTLRAARRVAEGEALANRSLVCTFSRKAADELRHRLSRLGVRGVSAGTIHRLALRMLVDWRDQDALTAPRILGDRRRLIGPVASTHGLDRDALAFLDTEIGWAKARLIGPDHYELEARRAGRTPRVPAATVAELFAAYEAERRRRPLLDLDDLLLEAVAVMDEHEAFAAGQRWRYRHVFLDEMQDVNPAQFRLLRSIVGDDPDLFVVGDPRQSVYGWNGADPGLLDDLPRLFPGARVIRLEDNHRCTPAIVSAGGGRARAATGDPEHPAEGPCRWSAAHPGDEEEARGSPGRHGWPDGPRSAWSHIAVLARTNAQLAAVAEAAGARDPVDRAAPSSVRPATSDGRGSTHPSHDADAGRPMGSCSAPSTGLRACSGRVCFVIGLRRGTGPGRIRPFRGGARRRAPSPLCRPDPGRRSSCGAAGRRSDGRAGGAGCPRGGSPRWNSPSGSRARPGAGPGRWRRPHVARLRHSCPRPRRLNGSASVGRAELHQHRRVVGGLLSLPGVAIDQHASASGRGQRLGQQHQVDPHPPTLVEVAGPVVPPREDPAVGVVAAPHVLEAPLEQHPERAALGLAARGSRPRRRPGPTRRGRRARC